MDMNGFSPSRYKIISKMIETIAKREGITNLKIDVSKGSEKGEGYLGEKHSIHLRGSKCMELFVKAVPSAAAVRKALDLRLIYLMEILFYKEILPAFMDLQARKNISEPFKSVVECVDTCTEMDHELLILKNIKSVGYELSDKKKQMNAEHVTLVYTEYGKFHALSYALKNQQPILYEKLVSKLTLNTFKLFAEKMMDGFIKMAANAKALFDPVKEAKVYDAYSAFVDGMQEYTNTLHEMKDEYSVIIHGDCWSNNMMFKYDGPNKQRPSKMCLLDFQVITEASPVRDLAYFTYASAPAEIYNNLDHYLHVYHASLSKTLRELGNDPEVVIPFMELKNQWKTHSKYGLMMAIILLKVCVQDQDETVELSEALEETGGADFMIGFSRPNKNDDLYYQRLKCLIVHMVENNFI